MTELQELISRGRFVFEGAPKRLEVFKLINSTRTAKDIARKTGRSVYSVSNDITKLKDLELIEEKKDRDGNAIKNNGSTVYEKTHLIKHIPLSYFRDVAKTSKLVKKKPHKKSKSGKLPTIRLPSEQEILDICKEGEVQLYEFKAPGTETHKITKEIAAFLHTKNGGIIFYGIEDDGAITGTDLKKQNFDQKLQNSVRNTISPQPNIEIKERNVMGSKVIMVIIPPRVGKTLYQYTKTEKYYIRRGANIFALKSEEIRELSQGKYVV